MMSYATSSEAGTNVSVHLGAHFEVPISKQATVRGEIWTSLYLKGKYVFFVLKYNHMAR